MVNPASASEPATRRFGNATTEPVLGKNDSVHMRWMEGWMDEDDFVCRCT